MWFREGACERFRVFVCAGIYIRKVGVGVVLVKFSGWCILVIV